MKYITYIKNLISIAILIIFSFNPNISNSFENNISREELRSVVKEIKANGWDTGLCDWRGLDSDVYLEANEKYEFDEVTSLYKIHCFAGASHDKYQFLFSIKNFANSKSIFSSIFITLFFGSM